MASVNKIKKTAVISQEDVVVTERENYSKVLLQKTCMMFPASKPNQISEKEINIVDDGDSSRYVKKKPYFRKNSMKEVHKYYNS